MLSAGQPSYDIILNFDARIRGYPLPSELQKNRQDAKAMANGGELLWIPRLIGNTAKENSQYNFPLYCILDSYLTIYFKKSHYCYIEVISIRLLPNRARTHWAGHMALLLSQRTGARGAWSLAQSPAATELYHSSISAQFYYSYLIATSNCSNRNWHVWSGLFNAAVRMMLHSNFKHF